MLRKLRMLVSRDYLLGFAVVGGFLYTNRNELHHLWRHYRNALKSKKDSEDAHNKGKYSHGGRRKLQNLDVEDCTKYYPTFAEAVESLCTGDLVFIRYNGETLQWYNRYRITAARWLSKNRFYDDVAVVYKGQGKTYLVFMPSVTMDMKAEPLGAIIPGIRNLRKKCVALEVQQMVKHFVPDMITVKRLVCDERIRATVSESIKVACEESRRSIRSNVVDVLRSWRDPAALYGRTFSNYMQCTQFAREYELIERSYLPYGSQERTASSASQVKDTHQDDKALPGNLVPNRHRGGTTGTRFEARDIEDMRKMCESVTEEYEKNTEESLCLPKRLCGATHLIVRVYARSGLITDGGGFGEFQIQELFNVDFLPVNSRQGVVIPRLSEPFHLFNGSLYKTRFQNLKEWSNIEVLENRL
ncbi:methyl-accepting chemotaxis, putative [Babesia caballi]|uniref:Methyl-accepting chemotaxis, putative n=1 Tax=Babesia caballi TaxID=5871 RepID=A0AAV4M0R8_BABCB|nr:methyl-accepting chemotaxis, putative [Babesia caballi]